MNARTLFHWCLGPVVFATTGCESLTGSTYEEPPVSKYQSVSLYPLLPPPGTPGPSPLSVAATGRTAPPATRLAANPGKSVATSTDNPSTGKAVAAGDSAVAPAYWKKLPSVSDAVSPFAAQTPKPAPVAVQPARLNEPIKPAAGALPTVEPIVPIVAPPVEPVPVPAMPAPGPGQPLPVPRPVEAVPPPEPIVPPGQPGTPWRPATPGELPLGGTSTAPVGTTIRVGPVATPSGSNVRVTPTVTGAKLNLAPHEQPGDRVVELARQLEITLAQNRELVGRVRELEAMGLGREQALAEAFRDAEIATAEVAKTRGQLLEMRAEIVALRAKLQQLEKEDIELLRAVLSALERLMPSPSRREP